MKTKKEVEQNITNITNTIHQNYPELNKYIVEMPSNNSGNEEQTIKKLEDYYHSLKEHLNKYTRTHKANMTENDFESPTYPGYPPYPASNDIYQQGKVVREINPENISITKTPNEDEESMNEKSFRDDMSGDDLDIPGAELDDQQESVGSEDEENNYYSLGGDNHTDLEEDNG